MEIERSYKLEKAVSKDPTRPTLRNVSVTRHHAMATDGRIMAIVPIMLSKEDTPGWLTPDALKLGRKATPASLGNIQIELNGAQVFIDGTSMPRPNGEDKPPRILQILLDAHRNRTMRFGINASSLKDLADALGSEMLILELATPEKSILVRPPNGENKAVGLIMPVRVKQ